MVHAVRDGRIDACEHGRESDGRADDLGRLGELTERADASKCHDIRPLLHVVVVDAH